MHAQNAAPRRAVPVGWRAGVQTRKCFESIEFYQFSPKGFYRARRTSSHKSATNWSVGNKIDLVPERGSYSTGRRSQGNRSVRIRPVCQVPRRFALTILLICRYDITAITISAANTSAAASSNFIINMAKGLLLAALVYVSLASCSLAKVKKPSRVLGTSIHSKSNKGKVEKLRKIRGERPTKDINEKTGGPRKLKQRGGMFLA